ncbi:MAG: hypothetical protein ABIQ73_01990 [Acidimicrobiales bacterium]
MGLVARVTDRGPEHGHRFDPPRCGRTPAGDAHLRLKREGSGTEITATWTLEMMQPAMRFAARVMPGVMRWGHDRVVDATADALGKHLQERSG